MKRTVPTPAEFAEAAEIALSWGASITRPPGEEIATAALRGMSVEICQEGLSPYMGPNDPPESWPGAMAFWLAFHVGASGAELVHGAEPWSQTTAYIRRVYRLTGATPTLAQIAEATGCGAATPARHIKAAVEAGELLRPWHGAVVPRNHGIIAAPLRHALQLAERDSVATADLRDGLGGIHPVEAQRILEHSHDLMIEAYARALPEHVRDRALSSAWAAAEAEIDPAWVAGLPHLTGAEMEADAATRLRVAQDAFEDTARRELQEAAR